MEQPIADEHVMSFVQVSPAEQVTLQRAAVQVIGDLHEPPPPAPHSTVHTSPPHVTPPWHESPPVHWMSHARAFAQLTAPWQLPPPHLMMQL